ncbi:MAG: YafY family transcriptional regulator [Clostridiales bacterium]|nr:YafY family transcriptional regulator [Clostridiales bacterium]
MKSGVMFGILLTILNNRKVKSEYLAEKFEVSTRTVARHIDSLCEGGVPIISVRGINGGYMIADDFRLERSFFTKDELHRLLTCLNATATSFDGQNHDIIEKLKHMGSVKENEKYLLKTDTLIIDVGTWTNPQSYRGKIETINKAIDGDLTINMEYTDNKDLYSIRDFDPYCLVLKEGVWYVYGFCHLRNDFRLFRLARIKNMTITENKFERKESDVYEKLNGVFDDTDLVELEFEFFSTALSEVEEWLGHEAISERGHTYIAKASLYGGNLLINKLLSFGSSIKILKPQALKEELLVECRRVLKRYDY